MSEIKFIKRFIKSKLKKLFLYFPFIGSRIKHYDLLRQELVSFHSRCGFEPGHYYSPIPNLQEVENDADRIFQKNKPLDVNLNQEIQFSNLLEIREFYEQYPYLIGDKFKELRYSKPNSLYRYSDAVFLYGMLRLIQPAKVIEVGSGHSSAVMLDTNELFLGNRTHFTFIEPYPDERLRKILKDKDAEISQIIPSRVQDIDPALFSELKPNDILFIDSTHVCKTGSDLNYLLFEVIPRLQIGVFIHFHDIFYPFEMPKEWVLKNHWFWNENYLLKAFLMNNPCYEIFLFNSFLAYTRREWFEQEMPECLKGDSGIGSIWLKKRK